MNKENALIELCTALLQDTEINEQNDWCKLIIICEVEEDVISIWGYSYDIMGNCLMISPSLSFDDDKFQFLHNAMKLNNPKGKGWLKCMIRISRTGKFGADFEYNDTDRWSHTIDNGRERMKEYASLPV